MMRTPRPRALAAAVLCSMFLALAPTPASAYIDPGTGSFVVQGIIAAIVGGGLMIKLFWRRIVRTVTRRPAGNEQDGDA